MTRFTRLFLLAVMTIAWLMPAGVYAWDMTPDPETGLYDGLYDRPTFFPSWEQPNTWPGTMYVLCEVRKESVTGERMESYEIAVYDQNKALRHCNRSLATQDHYCVLTIPGEDGVDRFHFQVLYGDDFANPLLAEIEETTLDFETNASVGTKAEPFVLVVTKSAPTGVDETVSGERLGESGKVLCNGQLLILRGEKSYTAFGQEINVRR